MISIDRTCFGIEASAELQFGDDAVDVVVGSGSGGGNVFSWIVIELNINVLVVNGRCR